MTYPGYQDIASAAMGGAAAQTAPTFQQSGWNTIKQLGTNKYNRGQLRRNWGRQEEDFGKQFENTARVLPGVYNQKGMLDSGVYQAGANRAISDNLQSYNRAAEDYNQRMMNSYLSDDRLVSALGDLKGQLTSQQYQSLVASMVNGAGGAA